MSGLLNDAVGIVFSILEDAGLPVVDDPRNARPPAVIIEPPTFTPKSASLVQLDFPITCVAPPPGNRDANTKLLELADQIVELPGLVTISGAPGQYTTQAGQEFPSYQLTVQLTVRRT